MAGSNTTFLRGAHFKPAEPSPREVEHAKHNADKHSIARASTVAKTSGGAAPIHGGMHTKAKTGDHLAFAGGNIKSALESGSVGPSIGDVLTGYPKNHDGGASPIHPSMASAAKRSVIPFEMMHELGRKILDTATGPDRNGMPRVRR